MVPSISYKLACAYSEDSNQSAHLHSLISLVFYLKKVVALAIHRMPIKDSDLTAQTHSLIRVFDGGTCQLVPFAGHRLR